MLLLVFIWAVAISAIPLVASLLICMQLISRPVSGLIPPYLQGEVEIHFDSSLQFNDSKQKFYAVSTLHAFSFICFQGKGQRWLLWRDSCDETTYRQLLVRLKLKQEHEAPV